MDERPYAFGSWFVLNWSRAALPMSAMLLALAPILFRADEAALLLIYLQIPAYMIHQYEEHADGRFHAFVTEMFGAEVLGLKAIVLVNVILVWVVQTACLAVAAAFGPAWGLLGAYLPLLNGVSHVATTVRLRRYNPGFWTSVLLFLPLSGFTVYYVDTVSNASLGQHALAVVLCLAVHAIVLATVAVNRTRLSHAKPA